MALLAVITTTATEEEARAIARALVDRGLAACVQISPLESFYIWQGAVQQEPEYRVVAKTTEERYPDVEQTIKELHSYELPAIYGLPLHPVYAAYAEWVRTSSRGSR